MLSFDQTLTPMTVLTRRLAMFYLPKTDEGQGLVEYALILVLVAIVVIAILVILGPQIGNIFSRITNGLGGT
jgi:pilus assembly protein Flp/PilA